MLRLILSLVIFLVSSLAYADTIEVYDTDINAGDTVHWTSNNVYVLNNFVFVEENAVLTIDAGTVIKGKPGQAGDASALIICRGAKIFAEGTATNPIIFTGETDDVNVIDDIDLHTTKLWGGLIILGKATNNDPNGESHIEGIPESESRGVYGGTDDDDNSGVLRYVSLRHGGSLLGANNEINGVSFGSVGRGTTVEYVEVFSNADDGFEFFGGTVNVKHLVSAFNQDDCFDTDEGYRGKAQFLFALQSDVSEEADCLLEQDGAISPETSTPWSIPQMYNMTLIGPGSSAPSTPSNLGMNLRDNTAGTWANNVIIAGTSKAISIETPSSGEGSVDRLKDGSLVVENNIFYDFGAGSTLGTICKEAYTADSLTVKNNSIENPLLVSISRTNDNNLDPRPESGSPVYNNMVDVPSDGFFTQVNYKGAFGSDNWLKGWTALDQYGYLKEDTVLVKDKSTAPSTFSLSQNSPNPFNPSTTISFAITEGGPVKLSVYNLAGQLVSRIVDSSMTPGAYSIKWKAGNLASGTYIYRLETATGSVSKKMMFVK